MGVSEEPAFVAGSGPIRVPRNRYLLRGTSVVNGPKRSRRLFGFASAFRSLSAAPT
jgi:hypothetical protein